MSVQNVMAEETTEVTGTHSFDKKKRRDGKFIVMSTVSQRKR